MAPARWLLRRTNPSEVRALAAALDVSEPAARVLCARGLTDAGAARRFLDAPLEAMHDPFAMAGMCEAVERLTRAIRAGEKILIYGDYYVDGTTAVVFAEEGHRAGGGRGGFSSSRTV